MTEFVNTGQAVSLIQGVRWLYSICFSNTLLCALGKEDTSWRWHGL